MHHRLTKAYFCSAVNVADELHNITQDMWFLTRRKPMSVKNQHLSSTSLHIAAYKKKGTIFSIRRHRRHVHCCWHWGSSGTGLWPNLKPEICSNPQSSVPMLHEKDIIKIKSNLQQTQTVQHRTLYDRTNATNAYIVQSMIKKDKVVCIFDLYSGKIRTHQLTLVLSEDFMSTRVTTARGSVSIMWPWSSCYR